MVRAMAVKARVWAVILAPLGLAACQPAVLDPQGPVGMAEKSILIDSLAIMLAIVVPTILATLAFAWWFRASNTKARYRPDWAYSGQIELIVWGIPLLVITLLGGVAWIGSHELDPAVPLASNTPPIQIQGVSLDWKWLFIYPDQHVASVNQLVVPAGVPIHFALTSASVMNAFFIPQLGSMIYTMNGMTTQLNLKADQPGDLRRPVRPITAATGSPTCISRCTPCRPTSSQAWVADTRKAGPMLDTGSYAQLAKQSLNVAPFTYRDVDQGSVPEDRQPATAARPRARYRAGCRRRFPPNGALACWASLAGRPSRSTSRSRWSPRAWWPSPSPACSCWILVKGWLPYLWKEWITSVDHKRIGVMYALLALVMLLRGFSDAIMMRSQQALAFRRRATCRPSITTRSSPPTAR